MSSSNEVPARKASKTRWFNDAEGFVCIPKALALDTRLTLAELRVLLVLSTFAIGKDKVWPSRETLVSLTGLNKATVSAATTRLSELGWLEKRRTRRNTNYELKLSEAAAHAPDNKLDA